MTFCMTLVNFFPFIVLINKMQKSKKLFPCEVCFKNCKTNCIECSTCLSWFHSKCLKMREEDLMTLGGDNSYFHCQNCAKTTDGKFNFELGLRRLANSVKTGEQSFFASALSEQIASRTENILEEVNDAHDIHETDNILPFKSNWSSLRYHALVQNCNSKQRLDTVLKVFVTTQLVT